MSAQLNITPAQDIVGEINEARSDLFRASRPLDSDHPTADDYDTALRAISDAQQRIEWAADLIRAEMKRL